jgi:drug/metabolite transporter superfamily protein YnfA
MKKKAGLLWMSALWYLFLMLVVVVPNYQELREDGSIWFAYGSGIILSFALAYTFGYNPPKK